MGWASGLQAGIRLGETIRQGQLERDLAEEAKKYRVTEGAYGSELGSNIEQLRGLQQQNPELANQYEPAIAELQRRQGLTAPDYSVSSGGQNFATMQEAQRGVSQAQTKGLADVYRGYGMTDKASELEARAQQQQLTGFQLSKAQREDEDATRLRGFEEDFSKLENPADTAAIRQLAQKHKLSRAQQFTVASQVSGIEKADLEMMDTYVKKAVKGKDLDGLLTLHKDDKNFADGTHFVKAVGRDGQIILNLVSDADPTKVLRTESFKNADMATAYLRKQAEDPGNVAEWALGVRRTEAQIGASEASTRASNASVGLTNARLSAFKEEQDNRKEAAKIQDDFAQLSEAEKNGPKGAALIRQFNMVNAKAGGQVSLGPQGRPGQTMTDVEAANLREYRKWENDDRNLRLPQADKDKKAASMGVLQFVNPGTANVGAGLGSNPYANATQTAAPAAALSARPAASTGLSRTQPVEPNPYVDARGRPILNAPRGEAAPISRLPSAISEGVSGLLSTGEANYRNYLLDKINRGADLTPDETLRARRFDLID